MNLIYPKANQEKEEYEERYELSMLRIRSIHDECCDNSTTVPPDTADYFKQCSKFILKLYSVYHQTADGSLYQLSLEELQRLNHCLYEDILTEHYGESYANPAFARRRLGKQLAPYLCFLYTELRGNIAYAFEQRLFYLTVGTELFIEIYNLLEDPLFHPDEIQSAVYYYVSDYADIMIQDRTEAMLDPSRSFAVNLIRAVDTTDIRYLYYFGEYISENELGTAKHLNEMSGQQITDMASTFTKGYEKGFALYCIDLSQKSTVNIRYRLGFERMIKEAVSQFQAMGLNATIYRAAVSLLHKNSRGIRVGYSSSGANPQYDYDHRFDEALVFDKALADRKLSQQRHAYETYREAAAQFAGPAVVEVFGETPFVPETKEEAIEFSKKQKPLHLKYQSDSSLLSNEFIPGDQISFTIISYPVPEIGPDYREIFDATTRINTLDNDKYEKIQTAIIHALDQGEYVTVTGRNGNRTSLTIALQALEEPEHQTNFENCLADVNIPLGEVFTTPKLEGTQGILHITQAYLNELNFSNLCLEIRGGMIKSYSCDSFEAEADNLKFIEQNLLFGHKTLPMGEFAIGTNTAAYAMGRRFQISHLLPILIAEKTGPHFAFGDTCFSHEEELETFNPDGKQMTAKENTFSALRHTEPEKAYFNCHTDITIPYHELGDIVVHRPDKTILPIIENGRFTLPGTESLNDPL